MSLSIGPQGAAQAKLPLWDTISLSYSTYFRYFPDVLRISWLWLAVAAPLTGIANWGRFSLMAGLIADMKRGIPLPTSAQLASGTVEMTVLGSAAGLLSLFAGVSIAVAWHRHIILGEDPGFSGSNVATKDLWRYVGVGLAICLIVMLPLLVVVGTRFLLFTPVAGGGPPGFGALILIPVIFFVFLLAFAVMLRLSPLLPARAVGDLGLTFKETWQRTRGNTWRIFWGIAACTILPILAAQIVLLGFINPAMFADGFIGPMVAASTIFTVYYLLVLPIGIGFLSYSYWHFFRQA